MITSDLRFMPNQYDSHTLNNHLVLIDGPILKLSTF